LELDQPYLIAKMNEYKQTLLDFQQTLRNTHSGKSINKGFNNKGVRGFVVLIRDSDNLCL